MNFGFTKTEDLLKQAEIYWKTVPKLSKILKNSEI